ncbi:MAG TPA: DUF2306 domain-containing protein [Gemmatimonadaceae bacterium]|nr:DUF2306 domain-containing protein [Gemmatimonadaceae bacterium]
MTTVSSDAKYEVAPNTDRRSVRVFQIAGWGFVVGLAIYFAGRYALRYFHYDAASYGPFWWPRARWLLPHVTAGLLALFLGPLQFWSALRRRYARLHRWSGRLYLAGVAVGATMAAGLVWRMPPGLTHAAGLGGLAVAWVATSSMALVAIRRGAIAQHREWMIRSYVVTFAFVTYRALIDILRADAVGSGADRAAFASWFCWAIPLLITEVVLQGRKLLRAPRRAIPALPE